MASGTRLVGTSAKPVQKVRTSAGGVVCCTVCGSRLSAYNAGPNCYTHTVDVPWRGPGPRQR